jgi:murein hydrolase activator
LLVQHLLLLVFICLSEAAEGADTSPSIDEQSRRLEVLRSRISTVETERKAAETKLDALTEELKQSELSIARASKQLEAIRQAIRAKAGSLEDLKHTQRSHHQALQSRKETLAKHLRLAYLMRRQDYLKLLLNQEDPFLIGRGLAYHGYYNRLWSERIATVTAKLKELDALERTFKTETARLEQLQAEQQTKLQEIGNYRSKRQSIIAKLRQEISSQEQELKALREDEKRIEDLLRSLASGQAESPIAAGTAFAKLKGKLAWPSRGRITGQYGSPSESGSAKWQGVFIEAEPGTAIRAVSEGQVVFADWLKHFGLLVIIDHGDDYMSLYGHNQALYVSKGNWVKRGDTIGSVGDSGGNNVSGLYFEIRHKGVPANPMLWCQRLESVRR